MAVPVQRGVAEKVPGLEVVGFAEQLAGSDAAGPTADTTDERRLYGSETVSLAVDCPVAADPLAQGVGPVHSLGLQQTVVAALPNHVLSV